MMDLLAESETTLLTEITDLLLETEFLMLLMMDLLELSKMLLKIAMALVSLIDNAILAN